MAESGCYDVIGDMNQYVIALVSYVHTCKYVFYPNAANKNGELLPPRGKHLAPKKGGTNTPLLS